ncbi:MAG TPA: GNAT family N-acetyltransferase [Vineibacter sp.]|nr:GNAT family N-acetyltransferase [Vineibacter sp.]
MTTPTDIRDLRSDDAELAAALYRQCFDSPWERAWTAEEFARLLAAPGCFGSLWLCDRTAAGLVLARIAADEAEVLTLGVTPPFRRRGGARRLLAVARARCQRDGAHNLYLEVADDNVPARRLYAAQGLSEVGRRPAYFDRGADPPAAAIVLRLAL